MKTWYDLYKDRVNSTYFEYFKRRYKEFINVLIDPGFTRYMELGCGAANTTKAISELSTYYIKDHIISDNCYDMLCLARENTKDLDATIYSFYENIITVGFAGIKNYNTDDNVLIHSHGVLEHFTNKQINKVIKKYSKIGKQVHYVPSNKYKTPSRGDERLLSPKEWKRICKPDKIIPFNDGYDLILIFNRR